VDSQASPGQRHHRAGAKQHDRPPQHRSEEGIFIRQTRSARACEASRAMPTVPCPAGVDEFDTENYCFWAQRLDGTEVAVSWKGFAFNERSTMPAVSNAFRFAVKDQV
jgi:hypothetical protein